MATRRIGVTERRARLGVRHLLAARGETALEAARAVVALHGSDPASVFLSAMARMRSPGVAAVERELYDERRLVRMLGMRRTVFTVPAELVPVAQAACANDIARIERRRTLLLLDQAGVGGDEWLRSVEEATLAALRARGAAFAAELTADEPRLKERIVLSQGKTYEARPAVASRVLFGMAAEGRIVRGRPRGSWISSQFQWSPIESVLPDGIPELPAETARTELVRRWLASYGPGTPADLKWWTGLSLTQVRKALAALDTEDVDLDGEPGVVLASDAGPVAAPEPWVALLPALDPAVMGWAGRGWYLGEHGPALFDRSGNAGPTVWADGRIVGGWAQREDGEVVHRLLEDVGAATAAAVADEAARLAGGLAPVRVKPRFRTPLERELAT
ncbi:winged helix DNA-binding domain-containing protein [Actinomadura sp. DC4]|uniref:winged helix DNA-binding domain-containing protein n=1 Tax=Actinomadura sp. DC4 TaxID=3055069 RepID=UPI0025AFB422|nr:winged helix DNA-binding domain-containing protein [Actinomadura sp. DC4]MDN3352172.1 winged helix DNA-binding domain-containing protein [Actinomadura sp. DC4]